MWENSIGKTDFGLVNASDTWHGSLRNRQVPFLGGCHEEASDCRRRAHGADRDIGSRGRHAIEGTSPLPVAPAWSWTGFYGGINGGYGWNRSTGDRVRYQPRWRSCSAPVPDSGVAGVVRPRGGLFGGQAGYNWQSQSIVYGLEADIQWSGIKGSGSAIDPCCNGVPGAPGLFTANSKPANGLVRPVAGSAYSLSPNTLLYVTGGLIYGHESVSNVSDICQGRRPLSMRPLHLLRAPAARLVVESNMPSRPTCSGKVEGLWYDIGAPD